MRVMWTQARSIKCDSRFSSKPRTICLNYGLAAVDGRLDNGLADNASSFESPHAKRNAGRVEVFSIVSSISTLVLKKI